MRPPGLSLAIWFGAALGLCAACVDLSHAQIKLDFLSDTTSGQEKGGRWESKSPSSTGGQWSSQGRSPSWISSGRWPSSPGYDRHPAYHRPGNYVRRPSPPRPAPPVTVRANLAPPTAVQPNAPPASFGLNNEYGDSFGTGIPVDNKDYGDVPGYLGFGTSSDDVKEEEPVATAQPPMKEPRDPFGHEQRDPFPDPLSDPFDSTTSSGATTPKTSSTEKISSKKTAPSKTKSKVAKTLGTYAGEDEGKPLGTYAGEDDTLGKQAKAEGSTESTAKAGTWQGDAKKNSGQKAGKWSSPTASKKSPSKPTYGQYTPDKQWWESRPSAGTGKRPTGKDFEIESRLPSLNPFSPDRPGIRPGDVSLDIPADVGQQTFIDPETGRPVTITNKGAGIVIHEPWMKSRGNVSPPPARSDVVARPTPGRNDWPMKRQPARQEAATHPGSTHVTVTPDDALTDALTPDVVTDAAQEAGQQLVDGIEKAVKWLPRESRPKAEVPPHSKATSPSRSQAADTTADQAQDAERRARLETRIRAAERDWQSTAGAKFGQQHGPRPRDPEQAAKWDRKKRHAIQSWLLEQEMFTLPPSVSEGSLRQ